MVKRIRTESHFSRNLIHVVLLFAIGVSFTLNYISIFDHKFDLNGDNYVYYMLAHNLADGNGYVSDIGPEVEPHTHFPPGYPVFLSLLLRLFPDSTDALKIANGVLLFISILLMFRIIRKTIGKYGLIVAFISCMICTFSPILLRWSTIIMSEMLYLSISMGIIAICVELNVEKLKERDFRQILLCVILVILIFATYYVRTIGISVILATIIYFGIIGIKALFRERHAKWNWLIPFIIAACVTISFTAAKTSWDIRNDSIVPGHVGDYSKSFMNTTGNYGVMEDVQQWVNRIETNIESYLAFYIPKSLFEPEDATYTLFCYTYVQGKDWIMGIVFLLLTVIGIISMDKIRWLLISYIALTLGVLLLYQEQYAGIRYLVPIIPLLTAALLTGTVKLFQLLFEKILKTESTIICSILSIIAGIWIITISIHNQTDNLERARIQSDMDYDDENPYKAFILASGYFSDAPESLIVANRKPEIFYFHSKYHHSIPIPHSGSPEYVIDYLEKNSVNFVIVDTMLPTAYSVIMPAIMKYPERFKAVDAFGNEDMLTYIAYFE